MKRRELMVCEGRHCTRALEKNDRLQRAIERLPVEVRRVRCQKVCQGPMLGLFLEERLEWFGKMNSKKALRSLEQLISEGELPRALRSRRSRKRSGKLRA